MSKDTTPELEKQLKDAQEAEGAHIESDDEETDEEKDEEKSEDSEDDSSGDDDESAKDDSKDSDSESEDSESDKDDEDKDKDKEDEEDEDDDDSKDEGKPRKRPERYIPMKKYHSEKKEWEVEVDALKDQLKKLSKGDTTEKEESDAIDVLAEEHDVSPELVKGILALTKKGVEIPKETQEKIDRAAQASEEQEETTYFEKEWSGLTTVVEEEYPKSTKPQIKRARDLMDKLSHIEKYHDKDLDYILFKERNQFKDIFVEGRRTSETSKVDTLNKTVKLIAKDFEGKNSKEKHQKFNDLIQLSLTERAIVEKDMDPDTYTDWVTFVGQQEDGIEVSRGGKKLILK